MTVLSNIDAVLFVGVYWKVYQTRLSGRNSEGSEARKQIRQWDAGAGLRLLLRTREKRMRNVNICLGE